MIQPRRLFFLLFFIPLVNACSDTKSTDIAEALRPLWLIESNSATGSVRVGGRVVLSGEDTPVIAQLFRNLDQGRLGFVFFPGEASGSDSGIRDQGVRLVDGDRMRAVVNGRAHQLRRRQSDFNYITEFARPPDPLPIDLRLDYADARFAASVSTVDLLYLSDLGTIEQTETLSPDATIGLSWSVLDIPIAPDNVLVQRVAIILRDCNSTPYDTEPVIIEIGASDRAVSISASRFPQPDSLADGMTIGDTICHYDIQVIAGIAPAFLLSSDGGTSGFEAESITPIIITVGSSEVIQASVNYGAL